MNILIKESFSLPGINYVIESGSTIRINEASSNLEFMATWVSGRESTYRKFNNIRSFELADKDARLELYNETGSKDIWIDHIELTKGDRILQSVDWDMILMPKGNFSKDILNKILNDDTMPIKIIFLEENGEDIDEFTLSRVNIMPASNLIIGRSKQYPSDWLFSTYVDNSNIKSSYAKSYWSYFRDSFAKIAEDDEISSVFLSDLQNGYFIYMYY